MVTATTEYPTRPMETWQKMKELRRKLYQRSFEQEEQGGLVVVSQYPSHALLAGIGQFSRRFYSPYWGKAMHDWPLLVQYHEAADAAGFPPGEMCSSAHHNVGEMLLGLTTQNPFTRKNSPVSFVFELGFCPSANKMAQLASEILGVPFFIVDIPQEGGERAVKYVAEEMLDAIEWLTKLTGREFDDELFAEAVKNWWDHGVLRAHICYANRAVPAPLTYETIRDFLRAPSILAGHTKEVVDFYELVLAEVEERVRDGISALGVEACRLTQEHEPMFFNEAFLQGIGKAYGVVLIAGAPTLNVCHWNVVDNHWRPAPRFRDTGVTFRNREDALLFLARCYVENTPALWRTRIIDKAAEFVHRAQDWNCNGALIHIDAGCRGHAIGMMQTKRALVEAGFPVLTYEAANTDSRYFNAQRTGDEFETFLVERMGLRKL